MLLPAGNFSCQKRFKILTPMGSRIFLQEEDGWEDGARIGHSPKNFYHSLNFRGSGQVMPPLIVRWIKDLPRKILNLIDVPSQLVWGWGRWGLPRGLPRREEPRSRSMTSCKDQRSSVQTSSAVNGESTTGDKLRSFSGMMIMRAGRHRRYKSTETKRYGEKP